MKIILIIAVIIVNSLSLVVIAEEKFCIEENDLSPVSSSIVNLILSYENNPEWKSCNFIGKSINLDGDSKFEDFVVTTDSGCGCGNVKCPIWILRKFGRSHKVVLSESGYLAGFSQRKINGLSIISFNSASAGWSDISSWAFVGGRYQKFFTSMEVNDSTDKNPISATWINVFASNTHNEEVEVNVVRNADGKKSIIANFENRRTDKKLKALFTPDTEIYNLTIEKVGDEFYAIFNAESEEWKVRYCWEIVKNKLHFVSRNKNTDKTYYSKNLEKNETCSNLLK